MTLPLREQWQLLRQDAPGERFRNHHRRRREARGEGWQRGLSLGLGVVLILAGIVMLVVPGPGLLGIALGLGLFAGESSTLAAGLDRGELWLRKTFGAASSEGKSGFH